MGTEEKENNQDRRLIFVVNPVSHSGKGGQLWKRLEKILAEREVAYEVHFSQKSGDIARIAEELTAPAGGTDGLCLVILGGDGTVNEALQGIRDFERVRLGYIPTGSGNDLARNLGIGKKLDQALDRVLSENREMRMDLGCVRWTQDGERKERFFLVGCGIGYDAAVCENVQTSGMKAALNKIRLGRLTYLGVGLRQMFTAQYVRATILLDGERVLEPERMLFAVSMSHRYEGGGFCFCPQADPQDGLLDLCVVNGVPRWKFPIIIPFALAGRHTGFSGVDLYRAREVRLQASSPLWVQTDGEVPVKTDCIEVGIEKRKVRFLC